MKLLNLGCKKFHGLLNDLEDRTLTEREDAWMNAHRSRCQNCSSLQWSLHSSLNMLREATLDPEPERSFDRRVMRRLRVETVRESFAYWTPAMLGCALAFFTLFATLNLLTGRQVRPATHLPFGEARRMGAYPRFELNRPIRLDR